MKFHARIGLALSATALAALTACGSTAGPGGIYGAPGGSSSSQPAPSGELHTASTSLGTILVNGAGMTLYFYDHDKPHETASACTGPCLQLWPAVTTTSTPAITGVTGTFGTITGTDGTKQVTLNGLPLYTFAADKKPGDVSGQGYEGIWWVVDATGAKVTSISPKTSKPAYGGSGY